MLEYISFLQYWQLVYPDEKVRASVDAVFRSAPGLLFRAVVIYIGHLQALPHC